MTGLTQNRPNLLANLSVARRLYFLILLPLVLMFAIGAFSITSLNSDMQTFKTINSQVNAITTGNLYIRRMLRRYMLLLHDVNIGKVSPEDALGRLDWLEKDFKENLIPAYQKFKGEQGKSTITEMERMFPMISKSKELLRNGDRAKLELYLQNDLEQDFIPIRDKLEEEIQKDNKAVNQSFVETEGRLRNFLVIGTSTLLLGTLLTALLGYLIYKSIDDSLEKLTNTVRAIAAGNINARARLTGKNELAELGENFDRMVEERIATQARIDREHQQLNDSVFALLEAVSDLSERNLTVRAKVTEDATGPLADAINQLAEDTTDVLKQVREVAISVEATSQDVNRYALSVNDLAQLEQLEARETAKQLNTILQRLNSIAASAEQANHIADSTSSATRSAQESVTRSVENMSNIRSTVQETGKRLKRLGERSQEISQIIDVINHLSERTTVLALNASMQATAAGEAGRGFSMIAEEIQRLAESSRDSTNQISTLVRNIQQEANTTIATMDRTIEQVVNGASLAEDAAKQMQITLNTTNELVSSVEKIAVSSADQVNISKTLQTRTERILEATQTTGRELMSLTGLTQHMAEAGKRLMHSVNVFKLEA